MDMDKISKHSKKSKKSKKKKSKNKKRYSSSEDTSSEEKIIKKNRKKHKKSKRRSSSDSSSDPDEWVEKPMTKEIVERDSWMTNSDLLFRTTGSHKEAKLERLEQEKLSKSKDQYNPSTSVRELNPYWKDGGDGLPSTHRGGFRKPIDESNQNFGKFNSKPCGDWRKKKVNESSVKVETKEVKINLTDIEINELAAKVLKAEIIGNTELHDKLKSQLIAARENRVIRESGKDESILLTTTDSKGQTRPLQKRTYDETPSSSRDKKKKVDSHVNGERVRYFGDDDRYSLNEMFEREKFQSGNDADAEFLAISSKLRNKNDDLDDIFADEIQKQHSDQRIDERNRSNAIREHQKLERSLENCYICLDSPKHNNNLIIGIGKHIYLSVPYHRSLTPGHCFLSPIRHIPSTTQLDEDYYTELKLFRKTICRMFYPEIVIFFECAADLHKHPHMKLECVPIPEEEGAMAPMYFKKAILESEREWSNNKKLVELKHSNICKSIPKGLPYFSVEFGNDEATGYAHVIEDRRYFPTNFAQEIIGGMLDLDHKLWRKPVRESKEEIEEKVKKIKTLWKKYDFNK